MLCSVNNFSEDMAGSFSSSTDRKIQCGVNNVLIRKVEILGQVYCECEL